MSSALGVLHWTPDTFWGASYYEYTCAMAGYLASKGVKNQNERMTRDEFLNLKDQSKGFLV